MAANIIIEDILRYKLVNNKNIVLSGSKSRKKYYFTTFLVFINLHFMLFLNTLVLE